MIGKVVRGSDVAGLLRYLFGPGRSNEHTDPRLVAGYAGIETLAPPRGPDGRWDSSGLGRRLSEPLRAAARTPDRPVWHASVRAAPGDRGLTDAEWAQIAGDVVARVGLVDADDEGDGCRWVAVRHADDHIHLVATLARQDRAPVRLFRDYYRVGEACHAAEHRYGLTVTAPRDRTAAARPSRGEQEKAARHGREEPVRVRLCREVRTVAALATSEEGFLAGLQGAGLLVRLRHSVTRPGEITGYAVAWPDDLTAAGRPVWYGGGRLAADLSLPRLRHRWTHHDPGGPVSPAVGREARDGRLAAAAHAARQAATGPLDDTVAEAAADLAAVAARLHDGPATPGPLGQAAAQFARAARAPRGQQPPPPAPAATALRAAARDLRGLARILGTDQTGWQQLLTALAGLATALADLRTAQGRAAQARAAQLALASLAHPHPRPAGHLAARPAPAARPHRPPPPPAWRRSGPGR